MLDGELCVHPLELRILRLEFLEPHQLFDAGAVVLRFPIEVRGPADAVLAEQIRDWHAGLPLLENRDDLRFREPRLSHLDVSGGASPKVYISSVSRIGKLTYPRFGISRLSRSE